MVAYTKFLCILVQVYLVYGDYYTPSEEVGEELKRYDPKTDSRYPFELGLGRYYQGDIMLVPPENGRVSIPDAYTTYTWPNGTVPYEIAGNFSPRQLRTIQDAISMFHRYTCVQFVPKKANDRTFVTIVNNSGGCFSYIGRQQNNAYNLINLQTPQCTAFVGTPVHEMMHALGFFHEFVRPDRDDWITVNRSALQVALQSDEIYNNNFAKLPDEIGETYNITYNYGSVMHYSRFAGAADHVHPVLDNKRPWVGNFGNNNGFAPTDVLAVNRRYKCTDRVSRPVTGNRK